MNNPAGPNRQHALSPIPESPESSAAHLRPPVMVPGAPPPMKVIPPRLHNAGQVWQYNSQVSWTGSTVPEPDQPQLEVRNTRATSVHTAQNPLSASSESLERVQSRADQGPRRTVREPNGDHNEETHGLELEGLNRPHSNQAIAESSTQPTGLALDPGSYPGSQSTSGPGTSGAQVAQQANSNPGVQFAVFALPQDPNSSPGATPRQSTHHLPDSSSTTSGSSNLSELYLSFSGISAQASTERPNGPSQAQQPTLPNAPPLYGLAPAASSASTWGTVHSLHESRQSSFSNLPLQSLPDPVFDSQPASANPSISSIQQLPALPGFLTSTSNNLPSSATFSRQPSRDDSQTSRPSSSSDSRQQHFSVSSLPFTEQPQLMHPSANPPRSTSSLNLGLMSLGNSSRSDVSQQPTSMHRASSSQSSLPDASNSDHLNRSASRARYTPSRTQSTRPSADSQHLNSASSHSLPEPRPRRRTVSEDRHVGESNSKSSSQPSLPSSRDGRPPHSRHASTPIATLPGVGARTGIPIYLSPTNSTESNEVTSSSNSVVPRESAMTYPHSRSATAIPRMSPSEEPLTREPLRAQRRQSGRHATTPAILTQSRSDSQPANAASLARSNTISAPSGDHPRPSTSLSTIDHSVPSAFGGGLLLTMEPPSTSSAATADGQPSSSIHAPRPVNNRRSGTFFGFLGRSGR